MEEDDIDAAFYGSASEYGDDFEMADPEQIMQRLSVVLFFVNDIVD